MTYSPYGDRDSGGTRTDVDTEVHDDHDQEDRALDGVDGVDGDVNGHDASGHDANGAPFQRASDEDASVGGAVVDQDGNVVEGADPDGRDQPDSAVAESSDGRDAVYTEHGDAPKGDEHDADAPDAAAPDAEANVDNAAATDTSAEAIDSEASASEDADGHVRTDEATATDVGESEQADVTAERDSASEEAMAGEDHVAEDNPAEVPGDVADEHNEADAMTDADGEREYADGEPVGTAYGNDVNAAPTGTPTMAPAVDADPTAAAAGVGTYEDDGHPDGTYADDRHPDDTYADHAYADDTDADRIAAADGGVENDMADEPSDGDGPVAGAVDADYVAVGVAEPLSESEATGLADADGFQTTRDADDDAVPLGAAAAATATAAADETDDETAVGMMPGDAPVVDAPGQAMPDADATHDRWQQIQLGFIDDPRGSVESARSLVVEAVEARIAALRDRQTALDGWQNEATPDTEILRAAIKGYRDMLNSLSDTP